MMYWTYPPLLTLSPYSRRQQETEGTRTHTRRHPRSLAAAAAAVPLPRPQTRLLHPGHPLPPAALLQTRTPSHRCTPLPHPRSLAHLRPARHPGTDLQTGAGIGPGTAPGRRRLRGRGLGLGEKGGTGDGGGGYI